MTSVTRLRSCSRRVLRGVALVGVFATSGCKGCAPSTNQAPSSFPLSLPTPAYVQVNLQTTDPTIAMGNLGSQLESAHKAVARNPHDVGAKAALVGLLLGHSHVIGSPAELAEAVKLGEDALADAPDSVEAMMLHIQVRDAAHRFQEALTELDALDQHHKDKLHPGDTDRQRASLLIAVGRYDDAKPFVDRLVEQNSDTLNLALDGMLLGYMGKLEDADRQFNEAEARFHDVAPFPIADLYFNRASMWEREGDLPKATGIFSAAIAHLPLHAHSATHLAALVAPAEAVKILKPVADVSTDPEVWGALGVYENFVKDGSGDADIARAKNGYDELMKTLPEAYADHAGWFWLNVAKDPPKAFAAAEKNLIERQNSDAFELYLASAGAAGKRSEACAVAERAKKFPYPSNRLTEQLRLIGDCTGVPPPPFTSASAAANTPPTAGAAPTGTAAPSASISTGAANRQR